MKMRKTRTLLSEDGHLYINALLLIIVLLILGGAVVRNGESIIRTGSHLLERQTEELEEINAYHEDKKVLF